MAINHLLGVPSTALFNSKVDSVDTLWKKIIRAIGHNQHLMAGTNENCDSETTGLISGHAYSILAAHEVNHQGKNWRLLKMVNPWGYGEWTGEWSDESPLWTPELKNALGFSEAGDDGEFFMPIEQYYKYYCATSITVEMDKEKYFHSSYSYDFTTLNKGEFFQFEITKAINLEQS